MLIQFKRGGESDLPILESGEPAFTTDTNNFYIGTGTENIQVSGDQTYTFVQSVPSTEWTVELPAGFKKFPSVAITDSAGTLVNGGIQHVTEANLVILTFTVPFSGEAHFN
ncbi:MAG: hypothetical protein CVU00_15555 [Bacteroidetes bacterium HGW-Bacteroidetes-17]|jgi:hypothetical protein|nr:MAG: hypothetical protein CVU00_15555 [Bacteroidetes bacterium HGW-Bacteroidetes-17]